MLGTVLIIDDCEHTAAPLEIALASMHDIQVLMLSNAFDALKLLTNRDYRISAIVTDLHLPKMNGFELIDIIRKDVHYAKIPIVLITGDSNAVTRIQAFQKGANAYFPKPYSPSDVRHELERLLLAS